MAPLGKSGTFQYCLHKVELGNCGDKRLVLNDLFQGHERLDEVLWATILKDFDLFFVGSLSCVGWAEPELDCYIKTVRVLIIGLGLQRHQLDWSKNC